MKDIAMGDVSDELTDHAHDLVFDDLPPATVERAKLLVLDTLGAALAAHGADGCDALHGLVVGWGGSAQAGLIGYSDRVPARHAASLNATLARALELDDVHELGLTHATATMVPVALAAADGRAVSGRELLTAIVVGIDLGCRLSMAPITDLGGDHYVPRSMSRTYQTGTLAGSVVASRLLGHDVETMRDAFGNAYSQCAGNLQGLAEGTLSVRVQQGLCAEAAVLAAELAGAGISGTRQSLEGTYGWFQAFWGGRYDLEPLTSGLGSRFETDAVSVKPYACCKYGHTAIAAAVEAAGDPAFALDQVERIEVRVFSRDCWDLICEPPSVKADPVALAARNGWSLAQFSLPFMVASALVNGGLTTADLQPEARSDHRINALLGRIDLVLDDTTRGLGELPEPGHVIVTLADGQTIERVVRRTIGHPDLPMTELQQVEKFEWCASQFPAGRRAAVVDAVLRLEELGEISPLTDALYGAP
jgi:2-methylcitrate dehydratase PrpD